MPGGAKKKAGGFNTSTGFSRVSPRVPFVKGSRSFGEKKKTPFNLFCGLLETLYPGGFWRGSHTGSGVKYKRGRLKAWVFGGEEFSRGARCNLFLARDFFGARETLYCFGEGKNFLWGGPPKKIWAAGGKKICVQRESFNKRGVATQNNGRGP